MMIPFLWSMAIIVAIFVAISAKSWVYAMQLVFSSYVIQRKVAK